MHQAQQAQKLEAAAADARLKVRRLAVQLAQDRELDITDIAKATGISRQTIHRLIRADSTSVSGAATRESSDFDVGQRVSSPVFGVGTVERLDGPRLVIRFDAELDKPVGLHARLARVTRL
jgi:DNA-binding IclR family transcriptional regulator